MDKLAALQSEIRYMASKYFVWDPKIIYFYSTSTNLLLSQIVAEDPRSFVDQFVDFAWYYRVSQDDIVTLYQLVNELVDELGLLLPITLDQFIQLVEAK